MEGYTIAPVKWAQRKDLVIVTLDARDVAEQGKSVNLSPEGNFHFEAISKDESHRYKVDLELFDEILPDTAKWKVTDFCIVVTVQKKNQEAEHWPRLIKPRGKVPWITVDWSKWVDEDEEDEHPGGQFNMDDFDDLPDSDDEEEEEEDEAPANLDDLDEPASKAEESKE